MLRYSNIRQSHVVRLWTWFCFSIYIPACSHGEFDIESVPCLSILFDHQSSFPDVSHFHVLKNLKATNGAFHLYYCHYHDDASSDPFLIFLFQVWLSYFEYGSCRAAQLLYSFWYIASHNSSGSEFHLDRQNALGANRDIRLMFKNVGIMTLDEVVESSFYKFYLWLICCWRTLKYERQTSDRWSLCKGGPQNPLQLHTKWRCKCHSARLDTFHEKCCLTSLQQLSLFPQNQLFCSGLHYWPQWICHPEHNHCPEACQLQGLVTRSSFCLRSKV